MSTSIEWTDVTWNPVTGCTKVSPGCAHCYIERTPAFRMKGIRFERGRIPVQLHTDRLEAPLHWRARRRVFVNSMSDLFHEDVPDEFIDRVFGVMAATPQHTYQVLTKRPERMLSYLTAVREDGADTGVWGNDGAWFRVDRAAGPHMAKLLDQPLEWIAEGSPVDWPLPNVWLGVSVENQRWADERIPLLLQTPAAVRFLSCEPLLGPVDLRRIPPLDAQYGCSGGPERDGARHRGNGSPECPREPHHHHDERCKFPIDWVIVGGESGPGHRPFDPDWARAIRDQLPERAGVKLFVKQLGGVRPGGKLEDLPEDLRIRELPA